MGHFIEEIIASKYLIQTCALAESLPPRQPYSRIAISALHLVLRTYTALELIINLSTSEILCGKLATTREVISIVDKKNRVMLEDRT